MAKTSGYKKGAALPFPVMAGASPQLTLAMSLSNEQ